MTCWCSAGNEGMPLRKTIQLVLLESPKTVYSHHSLCTKKMIFLLETQTGVRWEDGWPFILRRPKAQSEHRAIGRSSQEEAFSESAMHRRILKVCFLNTIQRRPRKPPRRRGETKRTVSPRMGGGGKRKGAERGKGSFIGRFGMSCKGVCLESCLRVGPKVKGLKRCSAADWAPRGKGDPLRRPPPF